MEGESSLWMIMFLYKQVFYIHDYSRECNSFNFTEGRYTFLIGSVNVRSIPFKVHSIEKVSSPLAFNSYTGFVPDSSWATPDRGGGNRPLSLRDLETANS